MSTRAQASDRCSRARRSASTTGRRASTYSVSPSCSVEGNAALDQSLFRTGTVLPCIVDDFGWRHRSLLFFQCHRLPQRRREGTNRHYAGRLGRSNRGRSLPDACSSSSICLAPETRSRPRTARVVGEHDGYGGTSRFSSSSKCWTTMRVMGAAAFSEAAPDQAIFDNSPARARCAPRACRPHLAPTARGGSPPPLCNHTRASRP